MGAAVVGGLLVLLSGCAPETVNQAATPPPSAWLIDEAAQRGVDFTLDSGADGDWALPEMVSGGLAIFDMDGDDDLDLYFVQTGSVRDPERRPGNQLFENTGEGLFRDVTTGSGADDRGLGMGVATGDYDNDGLVDLYVTNVGPNVLLRNMGGGRFEPATASAGVGDDGFGAGAAFLDFDLDGDLDLFVANYVRWSLDVERPCFDELGEREYCGPQVYEAPAENRLYRNLGDGRFEDATEEVGLAGAEGTSLGLVVSDLTGDGWPDVFVANDAMADRLWVGSAEGRFVDECPLRGCSVDLSGVLKAGMGVDARDLDGDGDRDVLVGNLRGQSDSLFLNQNEEYFTDGTASYGLSASSRLATRFGLGLVDFDNDGRLDLLEVNGAIARVEPGGGYAEENFLFQQTSRSVFERITDGIHGAVEPRTSRGAAFGDLDRDGRIDAVVVNRDAPAELLMNRRLSEGATLFVKVLNRFGSPALGARVEAVIGGSVVTREVRSSFGYLSASDPATHYAFPPGSRPASVRIYWPGGSETTARTGDLAVVTVREVQ